MPLTHLYRFPIISPRYDGKTPAQRGPLQLYSTRQCLWTGQPFPQLAAEADM
jgi:hypothetical protein